MAVRASTEASRAAARGAAAPETIEDMVVGVELAAAAVAAADDDATARAAAAAATATAIAAVAREAVEAPVIFEVSCTERVFKRERGEREPVSLGGGRG